MSDDTAGQQRPANPEIAGLAHDIRMACMRVARQVRLDSATEVPTHHLSALARLAEAPGTAGDLAERERVSAPSMTKTIAALVEGGLVQRQTDSADRRVTFLAPTIRGQRLIAAERASRDDWMAQRLTDMPARDRATLARAADLLGQVVSG